MDLANIVINQRLKELEKEMNQIVSADEIKERYREAGVDFNKKISMAEGEFIMKKFMKKVTKIFLENLKNFKFVEKKVSESIMKKVEINCVGCISLSEISGRGYRYCLNMKRKDAMARVRNVNKKQWFCPKN